MKTAFGIRGFSKSEITKVIVQTEMCLKSQRTLGGTGGVGSGQMNPPESPSLHRSVSLEGLPTSESQSNIQMMSHTLTIKEVSKFSFHACVVLLNTWGSSYLQQLCSYFISFPILTAVS